MLKSLANYYSHSKSLAHTQQFETVRQGAGKNISTYLLKVETSSKFLDNLTHKNPATHEFAQANRSSLTLELAMNGLRDQVLCTELITKSNLI